MTDRSENPLVSGTTGATVARMKALGTWNPLWDGLEQLAPAWTDKFMAAAMDPCESPVLSPEKFNYSASRPTRPAPTCMPLG